MAEENIITVSEEYLKRIEKKVEDLKTLMEVSAIISSTLNLSDLMTIVMEKAKAVMDADACSILLYNKDTKKLEFEVALCTDKSVTNVLKKKVTLDIGQGIAGWVAANQKPLFVDDVKNDSRFYREVDRLTGFQTKSLIAVPLIGRSGLIGVAEILNPGKKDYDMEIFQLLCRQFAISIENAIYHKESIQKERLQQELEIASSIQRSFLPESNFFKLGDITVFAMNISAAKVGGDLYDYIEPVEGKAGVFIGDVSGKGVSAALYMAKIISDFRYIAHMSESPGAVLNKLNLSLSRTPRGMFLTAIYMIADASTGSILVSVAGHPPILWITDGALKVMDVDAGPPIGILPTDYPLTSLSLKKGDRLLLLTDGVFEAKNEGGERMGFENIVSFIKNNLKEDWLVQKIIDYVSGFSGDAERADDLTIVELRWGESP